MSSQVFLWSWPKATKNYAELCLLYFCNLEISVHQTLSQASQAKAKYSQPNQFQKLSCSQVAVLCLVPKGISCCIVMWKAASCSKPSLGHVVRRQEQETGTSWDLLAWPFLHSHVKGKRAEQTTRKGGFQLCWHTDCASRLPSPTATPRPYGHMVWFTIDQEAQ